MIWRLRKKFILIGLISLVSVFSLLFITIYVVTTIGDRNSLDHLADIVSQNRGTFPEWEDMRPDGGRPPLTDELTPESPFTTRFFTVKTDSSGRITEIDTHAVAGVEADTAASMGELAFERAEERGWVDDYRYKITPLEDGVHIVFISGVEKINNTSRFLWTVGAVLLVTAVVIMVLMIVISQYAVKPTAESYEKQKQFITNASHELKTPLTLIRANLDIMEEEMGQNEWLTDMREETMELADLVDRMVSLAKMDEECPLQVSTFSMSEAVEEMVSHFLTVSFAGDKHLIYDIAPDILYKGEEASIRRLISVLMDNALKYCDEGGQISVTLKKEKKIILVVENTYRHVKEIALDRIFDRFYRVDGARTTGSGFGIGLSIAKATVERHKGSIRAVRRGDSVLSVQVCL